MNNSVPDDAFSPPKDGSVPLVVVTGGGSGIGAATAQALCEAGFCALVLDIAPPAAAADGAVVWPNPVDVTDAKALPDVVHAIEERHGPVYGLVNAAGILGRMHPPERLRQAHWDRELDVDLRGSWLACRHFGAAMTARGRGAIVNVASVVGMSSGPVHGYGPAKAAVINMTSNLAAEWGPYGVRVNAVSPGFTRTPALEAGIDNGALDAEAMRGCTPLGRLVQPIEVGRVIAWLIGDGASAVSGINLPVDGGFMAGVFWQAYGGLRGPGEPVQA